MPDLVTENDMRILCLIAVALLIGLGSIVGCSGHSCPGPSPPRIDAVAAGRAAISQYDKNGDGRISGEELDKCPGLKAAIGRIDQSGSGDITADTIAARIKAWEKSHVGGIALSFTITHNGTPLGDADVKFVLEKFLGDCVTVATGKTDKNGVARITSEPLGSQDRRQGIATGFYRVEITKPGENIPAKYNTNTILGQEIAIDAKGIPKKSGETINIDLTY
jgi:hypothetical protein